MEFDYIKLFLKHMNFGEWFLTIASLYHQLQTNVRINQSRSQDVQIRRGTRKGCPLSPLIITLCIEPLANLIRAHLHLQGIMINHVESQVSLFADYVVLYLSSPTQSIHHLTPILSLFAEVFGLSINKISPNYIPYVSQMRKKKN